MVIRRLQGSDYPAKRLLPARCRQPPASARNTDSLPNRCQWPGCLKSYKYQALLLRHLYLDHRRRAADNEALVCSYNDCEWPNSSESTNEENQQIIFGSGDKLAGAGQEDITPAKEHLESYSHLHQCEYLGCEKSFARKSWLQRHKRDVHRERAAGEKPILCPYSDCKWANGVGFQREENRRRHLRNVHKFSNKAQRTGTAGESYGNGLPFDSFPAEGLKRKYDTPHRDHFGDLNEDPPTALQGFYSDLQESDIEVAAVTRFIESWDKAMSEALIRQTEEQGRKVKYSMHSNEQSRIVWEIAKAQQKETPRIFSEAMRVLARELKTPNFITGLLGIIVQSTAEHVRPLQVARDFDEYEEIAKEKLSILFNHSKLRFGWPGGLITCVQDLRILPIYLEEQYLDLLGKARCYPI